MWRFSELGFGIDNRGIFLVYSKKNGDGGGKGIEK